MGIFQNLFSLDTSTRNQVALIQNMMTLALVLLAILHAASGRLIHRHHHHHHSPAAAPSAKCSGSRTAVEGFPKKCYVYYYQPNKVDWFASYNLCHSSGGRLFTPESTEEMNAVEERLIPAQVGKNRAYYVSYVMYASQAQQPWYEQNLIYMPYTPPYSLLGSSHWTAHPGKQSDMWAKGQPDGSFYKGYFDQPCIVGEKIQEGTDSPIKGLSDTLCTWKYPVSVICEFPSEQ